MKAIKSLFLVSIIIVASISASWAHGGYRPYGGRYWGGYQGQWGGYRGYYRRPNFSFYFGAPFADPFYYPYYPYYSYSPVIIPIPSTPPVYLERNPPAATQTLEANYWYFCQNPEGYYPNVTNCPGGWIKVPPRPN